MQRFLQKFLVALAMQWWESMSQTFQFLIALLSAAGKPSLFEG
jgi:hypothetical protein